MNKSMFFSITISILFLFVVFSTGALFLACSDKDEEIDPKLDTDGDKIMDVVEVSDLGKQIGLNRYHKDVVVEIDYFTRTTPDDFGRTSYIMEDNAKAIVEKMFNDAPVDNPKGGQGISIHLIIDDAIPNDSPYICKTDQNGYFDWTEFQVFRDLFFTSEYKPFAHYCLFVKDIGIFSGNHIAGVSGISRNGNDFFTGAQDFIISLGQWPNKENGTYVWDKFQAGTFAHELGHNLGLGHGGQNHTNYKPNYLSIMNYSFQTYGVIKTGQGYYSCYDYSRTALPDLVEVTPNQTCQNIDSCAPGLTEATGLGSSANGYGTIYYFYNGYYFQGYLVNDASANIDWNRNGQIDAGKIWANVNQDLLYCGQNTYHNLTTLKGFSDWDKLNYSAGNIFGNSSSSGNSYAKNQENLLTKWVDELTYEQNKQIIKNIVNTPR